MFSSLGRQSICWDAEFYESVQLYSKDVLEITICQLHLGSSCIFIYISLQTVQLPGDRGLWFSRVVLERWPWKGCSLMTLGEELCTLIISSPWRQSSLSLYDSFTQKMAFKRLFSSYTEESLGRQCSMRDTMDLLGRWSGKGNSLVTLGRLCSAYSFFRSFMRDSSNSRCANLTRTDFAQFFERVWLSWKDWFLTIFKLGGCGGLVVTNFR